MLVERALELCNSNPKLSHISSMLESNLDNEDILSKGINPKELYIGYRTEDNGWVIGYKDGSSSVVDVGLLACWWCVCITPLNEEEFCKLQDGVNGSTFQSISSKRY